jgi:hypothetical protein
MGADSEWPLALAVVIADDRVVRGPAFAGRWRQRGYACRG